MGRVHNLGRTCGANAVPLFGVANWEAKKICSSLKRLLIYISDATTNQKHAGVTEERKVRRFDWGGAWGKHDSIVLGAIELGGG